MSLLQPQDILEKRVKCNGCGQDLSYLEFMFCDGKCVFCAEGGQTAIKTMSKYAYIRLLLNDIAVVRGKLSMKAKGLTAIDWQACVSSVVPELHDIDADGLRRLVGFMKAHREHALS